MSVSTEIERLTADRNTIRDKLVELGLAESTANLTALAAAIEDIVNQGAVQVEILEGTSYTIPAGFHNGSGTVKAMTDVTGEAEKYKVQAKGPITPTKNQQSITPDTGYYALSAVTVAAIPAAYQNVSSVTAAKGDVLVGKVIVTADGTVTTGTMANNEAVTHVLSGYESKSFTIPAGYHNGSGEVSMHCESKSVTPTKGQQYITPSSGKVLGPVTVLPIPDAYINTTLESSGATAAHILKGRKAYVNNKLITGEMTNNGAVAATVSVASPSYTVPEGYHDGTGTVSVTTETKTVTPSTSVQNITPTSGKVLSKVTVNAIPSAYQDVSGVTATADKVLTGVAFVTKGGVVTGGSMPNKGAVTGSINGLTTTSYTIPAGYHNGSGTVSLTSDIEEALAAI